MQRWRASSDAQLVDGAEIVRPSRWLHSIAVVILSSVFLAGAGTFALGVELALVLPASLCVVDLVRREARDPGSPLPIVCSSAALFIIAVMIPPRFSGDLWSYAIAGRMVTVHHASPYLHAAGAFPHDPFLGLVGREWRRDFTTPYGPLFTMFAAGVAFIGGSHPLLYRLAFQGGAALSIGLALLVVWRTTRSTSALALLGLHPVITCSVINGGHNDAFIGLGLLVAVISTRRARYTRAGWWIAAALLVKATAGLALLPLMVWAWVRGRWRAVRQISAVPLLLAMPVMLLTPGMMHSLNSAKTGVITRASIWNIAIRVLPSVFLRGPHATTRLVSEALALVIVLVACAAWVYRRVDDPAPGVTSAMASWLVFSAYVVPWYTVWALPTAALRPRSRLTLLVAIQGFAITAASAVPRSSLGHTFVGDMVHLVVPSALVVMFVWAVVPEFRRGHELVTRAQGAPYVE